MASKATAVMNSAMGKWISTTCCACLAKTAVLRSRGFTIALSILGFVRRGSLGLCHAVGLPLNALHAPGPEDRIATALSEVSHMDNRPDGGLFPENYSSVWE